MCMAPPTFKKKTVLPMMGLMDHAQKYNEGDEYWYRAGENQCYDLRLFDSGAAGKQHI